MTDAEYKQAVLDALQQIAKNTAPRVRQKRDKRFKPPTEAQVAEYAQSIGFTLDANQFMNFYACNGWKVGKNKMKCWKASVRTWRDREVSRKTKLYPIKGKNCYEQGCRMPAVYKSAGAYDSYYCAEHMPDEVKKQYE